MTAILKSTALLVALIASMALGLTWLRAQEASQESQEPDASPISKSKWTAIDENNKRMLKSLAEIENNLNFAKARSMSGGKK